MLYSSIFIHKHLRTTTFYLTLSLWKPKASIVAANITLQPTLRALVSSSRAEVFLLKCRRSSSFPSICSAILPSISSSILKNQGNVFSPHKFQQEFLYRRFASEKESDRELDSQRLYSSTLNNIEEWELKLMKFMRNANEQEVVFRDMNYRHDFEQILALATRMGLYCRQYAKVVVFSKVQLPNYRPDLDDKRLQREVVLPYGLEKEVDANLKEYIYSKHMEMEKLAGDALLLSSCVSNVSNELNEQEEFSTQNRVIMERILRRKSLQLRDKQLDWKESSEGQKVLQFRQSLPAYKERDTLLSTISQNQVVIVSGETGCGKTTQLPQYILESEIDAARGAICNIVCTQPRRISAMVVSERVAAERGESLGGSVGYKVRLEGMKGRDTRLLFCTTGILLRRLLVDRNLDTVTHVIVDEIHERGMNEDFLLIVLKDLLVRRSELRLILMSATLNAELFSSYFSGAPMIHIPGFTYPVRSHFLESILETTGYRLTPYNQLDNYAQEKAWKLQKQALRKEKSQITSAVEEALEAADFREYNSCTQESLACWNPDSIGFNLIEHVLCHIARKERPGAVLVFMTGWDDINSLKEQLQSHPLLGDPRRVLLLACHGSMASSEQRLIFDKPEEGVRKIVLATNLAETSITINDVVFVVDCGKAKETSYDALNNTPCLLPSWISKASAQQRRGRAGRVQPGECYHLYPLCVYESLADYQLPELLRTPLQSLCLQIKSLKLGSISEFLSRALQSPEPLAVQNAIEYLKIIGALDEDENLTILGQNLSMLPVEPKLGKMLILGAIFNCLDPIMTVVACLSVRDPFLMHFDRKELAESAKAHFSANDFSDHFALVRAYEGWKDAEREHFAYEYCWKNFLSAQTMRAIDSLRKQFFNLLKDAGFIDNSMETCNTHVFDELLVRAVICSGLFPGICSVVNKEKSITLKTMEDGQVLLHSNSVNAREQKIPYPWLVFSEKVKINAVFLRDSTGVSDSMVLLFGGKIASGGLDGHLKMFGGYLEFLMTPALSTTYLRLKKELDEVIQMKLHNPKLEMQSHNKLISIVRSFISEDRCEGKFVFRRKPFAQSEKGKKSDALRCTPLKGALDNSKTQLQKFLERAGHGPPRYKTTPAKLSKFQSSLNLKGLNFVGQPCSNKKQAEKDVASQALVWFMGETQSSDVIVNNMSTLLNKTGKHRRHSGKGRSDPEDWKD